jgi:hypothetical protein
MFSLSGPTVITFPGFQTSTHETANFPRECADPPRCMVFCFKTFMQLIHSYVLIFQNNAKITNYSVERMFLYKVVGSKIREKLQKLKRMQCAEMLLEFPV